MSPTALWTPLEEGIRASIYSPGGPLAVTGCQLEESPEIEVNSQAFLDNFSGTDGSLLSGHIQNLPEQFEGTPFWFSSQGLELLEGSLVNPGNDVGPLEASIDFSILSTVAQLYFSMNFGAFSQENFTATARLACGESVILLVTITSSGGIITVTATVAGYDTVEFTPVLIDYCGWVPIVITANGNALQFEFTVGDGVTEVIAAPGGDILFVGTDYSIITSIDNVEANGARFADMEVIAPAPS